MLDAQRDEHGTKLTPRQLREFSLAWFVFFCALAAWQWFGYHRLTALLALCAVACSVGFVGLARPATVTPLFAVAMALALPIGWVITRVILGFLFFGLFTPVGWLFRRLRRDPLRLRKPQLSSYWSPAPSRTDTESYFRQSL
jgi:hypothetical protein